jgi:hypothetical protein
MTIRTAQVAVPRNTGIQDFREAVAQYLPANYHVTPRSITDDYGYEHIVIEGEDDAGWTLDDFVIPRLASGLYFCKEVQQ